jgi:thiol-disulfide isomerase/thioredoxin
MVRAARFSLHLTVLIVLLSSGFAVKSVRRLSLRDLEGNKVRLSDYQGQIVVLNFWATWCGPCKEELPRLEQISEEYGGQKVAFLLASIDDQKKLPVVRNYVTQQKITLPVLVGASTDLLNDLSGTYVVPATLIVDQDGQIVRTINGEAHVEDIKEAVGWLLSGKNGSASADRVKRY